MASTLPLLSLPFAGYLGQEQQLPTRGTISVDMDGSLHAAFDPFPINDDTDWLHAIFEGRTRTAPWVHLHGDTDDGRQFTTDYLILTRRGMNLSPDKPGSLTLGGKLSRLTITRSSTPIASEGCALIYRTIGMRGYARQQATTPIGTILLLGQPEIENDDEIAGRMHITSPPSLPLDDWLDNTNETLGHILRIISFAQGKPIFWSIRELYQYDTLVRTDFTGPHHTGSPEDNTFHFLNLQPVLTLAVDNYTSALREQTGISLAIDLFLSHPPNLKLRLLGAMTALEHLVSVHDKRNPPAAPLDKPTFRKLHKALCHAYDTEAATLQPDHDLRDRLKRVRDRIANLNHLTFKDRLWHMLTAYNVPLTGIADRINLAIDARNDIIHTGTHDASFKGFHLHVTILRELLKRTFLTLLRYQGQYQSYLNGPEWVLFPPTNVSVTE